MKKKFLTISIAVLMLANLVACTQNVNENVVTEEKIIEEEVAEATDNTSEAEESLVTEEPSEADISSQTENIIDKAEIMEVQFSKDQVENVSFYDDVIVEGKEAHLLEVLPSTSNDIETIYHFDWGGIALECSKYWGAAICEGNTVYFGRYEQDGNLDNGPEPIEWEIASIDRSDCNESHTKWMVLRSTKALDSKPFHDTQDVPDDFDWYDCTLQAWLNDEFYNTAFNDEEKEKIVLWSKDLGWPKNLVDDYHEAYVYMIGDNLARDINSYNEYKDIVDYGRCIIEPTQYAIDQGVAYSEVTDEDYDNYDLAVVYPDREQVVGKIGAWCWKPAYCGNYYTGDTNCAHGINQNGISEWSRQDEYDPDLTWTSSVFDVIDADGGGVVPVIIVRYGEGCIDN